MSCKRTVLVATLSILCGLPSVAAEALVNSCREHDADSNSCLNADDTAQDTTDSLAGVEGKLPDEKLLSEQVPVIDVSALMDPASYSVERWDETAEKVTSACEEWGFFQAVNHHVPAELLDRVVSKGRGLFALPKEVKARVKRTNTNARGWYDDELTKRKRDLKEGFDIGHVPVPELPPDHPSNVVAEGYNQWPPPETAPGFKETMDEFYAEATTVAERLLEGIASNLGLSRGHFAPSFDQHTSFLRLNYYTPCPESCDLLSVHPHTDAGALTVLLQENGTTALQVNHQSTGRWVFIPPVEGALTINVGDMLQVWSNDLFRAPEHRVVPQTSRDRLSAPFFYNPAYHADIAPLRRTIRSSSADAVVADENDAHSGTRRSAGGLEAQGPARYRIVNWGEFRLSRFAGDFADQGTDEVQISQYLLPE